MVRSVAPNAIAEMLVRLTAKTSRRLRSRGDKVRYERETNIQLALKAKRRLHVPLEPLNGPTGM